ncbi:hypothetical protein CRM22_003284 [Opisthorchis felineus]|uniref:Uncharacterized protein n=1 Tax=Opisthorchis felineus TaxID=147828 RepID=A0A4V3SFY4_OPIFE|nr:hypothetical protein CRM22_003284 [Opisthorchis felineus]
MWLTEACGDDPHEEDHQCNSEERSRCKAKHQDSASEKEKFLKKALKRCIARCGDNDDICLQLCRAMNTPPSH